MTLDPKILAEAQDVLRPYTTPAQKLIQDNLYGPREARLAGAIIKNAFTVVSYEAPTETEAFQEFRGQVSDHVSRLVELLERASTVIEESISGQRELLQEIEAATETSKEDFVEEDADYDGDDRKIFVVVFPPLDAPSDVGKIELLVKELQSRGIPIWVADENDYTKRLKAITVREIYNVGRIAAVVLADSNGVVLDGWYNGLPWIDQVLKRLKELR